VKTLTLRTTHRVTYGSGNPIGENTENVAFNIPKRAFQVLCDFCANKNRSAKIRQWIAEGMQRENTWSGLAFRAACKLSTSIKSLFQGKPEELAETWTADVSAPKPESVCGGEKVIDCAVEESADDKFIPKAGVNYPPEIKAQFPEIFGKGAK
jgi:hypothetical protein